MIKIQSAEILNAWKKNTSTQKNLKEMSKNRIVYFDVLNILACICVIFLHMNGIVHNYTNSRAWKTALIFEVICYWAVPVFIMLSGATLLKYRERYDTKIFFKKRFIKILIPWVIWSFIIYIINNDNISIVQFTKDFCYCKIESIYWFFPLILYLYCLIPIFSLIKEERKLLWGIVLFIFVFAGIIGPVCQMLNISFPTIFNYCLETNAYIMFLILGYLLSTTELSKKQRIIIYALGIFSIIFRYGYTYYFSISKDMLNKNLFNYCSFISVFLAVAVFVFVKNIKWDRFLNAFHINPAVITKISSCSFGIYLIHIIIKNNITNLFSLNVYSIWYRTIGAVILYILCLIIVYIIKQIPVLKKIVP